MKCPVCKTPDLLMTERQNIEIDYCPTCRGVWLDRGELDKLIGQMQDAPDSQRADAERERHARHSDRDARHEQEWGRRHESHDDHRKHYDARRKKKSLFDMFDFD